MSDLLFICIHFKNFGFATVYSRVGARATGAAGTALKFSTGSGTA
jgi:hypothetical protein